MEGSCQFNDIAAEPLTNHNYNDWFEWVKNYLIAKDLWRVTSRSARPERSRVKDFARWRRKNAAALHVIRISCGPHNLSFIKGASEAKVAWDILYSTYNNAPPVPDPPHPQFQVEPQVMTEAEEIDMSILYKAIYENNWSDAKAFIDGHPRALNVEFAASTGETPLHVAANFGNVCIVEELVRLVPPEYLEICNAHGQTPLVAAATHSGVIPIARCLINKNSNTLAIPTGGFSWNILVTLAFRCGLNEMGRYLYFVIPLHVFKPQNRYVGPSFLAMCLATGNLDIALDLLQRCKELLFAAACDGLSTIEHIALHLPNSLSKCQLMFWKRWIYHYIKIPSTTTTEHSCLNIQQDGESNKAHQGMKKICKMKLQHAQAAEILNLVCENMISLNAVKKNMIASAVNCAVRAENVEFFFRVTKANLESISLVIFNPQKSPLFFDAVEYRKAEIFNLLHDFRFKHAVAVMVKGDGCSLLHMAALLAPASQLNRISGATLQMQRKIQWFKEVESVVHPGIRLLENHEGLNPLEFFKINHKELRAEGEKWMKETASSCSVVGALIVTIMFAVAFTVPGGNDQTSGYPIFLEKNSFKVFLISDVLSLFSSTTSVLTFLGILTSRYAEEDFLYSLPRKLIIGLSTLFLSIATMIVAFSATIMIMLQHNSTRFWVLLPIIVLACVPVTLFVLLQFPLLVEVISSTYGPGIFKKKGEMWP